MRSTSQVIDFFRGHPTVVAMRQLCVEQKRELFLAGGAVRDVFLGRELNFDLDFYIHADNYSPVKTIREAYKKRFDEGSFPDALSPDRIDLTATPDVVTSVEQFDLTLHTVVIDCINNTILDPMKGINDIQAKRLRIPHVPFFITAPTAFFRPFRYAVELGFELGAEITDTIRTYRAMINTADLAVRAKTFSEFLRLWSVEKLNLVLKKLIDTELLQTFFPALAPLVVARAPLCPSISHLDFNLAAVAHIEKELIDLPKAIRESLLARTHETYIGPTGRFLSDYNALALTRLAALFHAAAEGLLAIDQSLPEKFFTPQYYEFAFQKFISTESTAVRANPKMVQLMAEVAKLLVLIGLCEQALTQGNFDDFAKHFPSNVLVHKQAALVALAHATVAREQGSSSVPNSYEILRKFISQP